MPFKSSKLTYKFPNDPYNKEMINGLCEDLNCALGLSRLVVGVKLFYSSEEYDALNWEEPRAPLAYCCIVEKATRGMKFKAKLEHLNCDGGTTALGLEPSNDKIESGTEYFSYNLYGTPAAAKRVRDGVPGLYRSGTVTKGIAVGPLSEFEFTPDVVIFMINPYQAMRLQQGYVYHEGGRIEITGASMQALCAEATAEPYLKGRLNLTPLCPSTRFLAKWKDEEMAIGIPFEKLASVVEGVIATISTTDNEDRKQEIRNRFSRKNKDIKFE